MTEEEEIAEDEARNSLLEEQMTDLIHHFAFVMGLALVNAALLTTIFPQGIMYWGYSWAQRIAIYVGLISLDCWLYSGFTGAAS